jgi:hypothetical protein
MNPYIAELQQNFGRYRQKRFAELDHMFEPHPEGGPVVFNREHVEQNLLIPQFPLCSLEEREQIVEKLPPARRHRFFASMRSSQALAQSVFGTIQVLKRLPLLSGIESEDGQLAFGPKVNHATLEFEKMVQTLGEVPPGVTQVDVWFEGAYRVAVEVKLAECKFGTCSRPLLTKNDNHFEAQHCDGSYTLQRGRTERCALSEINIRYWEYVGEVFGWSSKIDHRWCPLNETFQLARNVLAVCVENHGKLNFDRGHTLIIYDQRNPAMADGGDCDRAWRTVYEALRCRSKLRRLSWQEFLGQWPSDPVLDWLKEKLGQKYGLLPS